MSAVRELLASSDSPTAPVASARAVADRAPYGWHVTLIVTDWPGASGGTSLRPSPLPPWNVTPSLLAGALPAPALRRVTSIVSFLGLRIESTTRSGSAPGRAGKTDGGGEYVGKRTTGA